MFCLYIWFWKYVFAFATTISNLWNFGIVKVMQMLVEMLWLILDFVDSVLEWIWSLNHALCQPRFFISQISLSVFSCIGLKDIWTNLLLFQYYICLWSCFNWNVNLLHVTICIYIWWKNYKGVGVRNVPSLDDRNQFCTSLLPCYSNKIIQWLVVVFVLVLVNWINYLNHYVSSFYEQIVQEALKRFSFFPFGKYVPRLPLRSGSIP